MGNSIVEAMDAATAKAGKAPAAPKTGKAPAAPKAGIFAVDETAISKAVNAEKAKEAAEKATRETLDRMYEQTKARAKVTYHKLIRGFPDFCRKHNIPPDRLIDSYFLGARYTAWPLPFALRPMIGTKIGGTRKMRGEFFVEAVYITTGGKIISRVKKHDYCDSCITKRFTENDLFENLHTRTYEGLAFETPVSGWLTDYVIENANRRSDTYKYPML